jgi:hypothetical protein
MRGWWAAIFCSPKVSSESENKNQILEMTTRRPTRPWLQGTRALEQREILASRLRKTATKPAKNSSQFAVCSLNLVKFNLDRGGAQSAVQTGVIAGQGSLYCAFEFLSNLKIFRARESNSPNTYLHQFKVYV